MLQGYLLASSLFLLEAQSMVLASLRVRKLAPLGPTPSAEWVLMESPLSEGLADEDG